MTQTIKGLAPARPDLLINALLFRAGRPQRTALPFQTNKDGAESSSWAELPILLTLPSILITVNGFFASVSRILRIVWVGKGVVGDLATGRVIVA